MPSVCMYIAGLHYIISELKIAFAFWEEEVGREGGRGFRIKTTDKCHLT